MQNPTNEVLFTSGVLIGGDDAAITRSDRFESAVEAHRTTIEDLTREALTQLVDERVQRRAVVEPLVELGETDPLTIAELCALSDHLPTLPPEDWLTLLPVLRLFRSESSPTDGVPEPFVPIPGNHLQPLSAVYSHVLAYVWLDDCVPCDALKSRLESIFERPRGVLPFAVYGPAYSDVLSRAYGVNAGPVLLFLRGGEVDTRLHGAHDEAVIEREVETLLR